jgi:hypothetical protein
MPDERTLMLRHADQARTDFAIIDDELEAIRAGLPRIPTKGDLARTALSVIFCSAVLVIPWIESARHCL